MDARSRVGLGIVGSRGPFRVVVHMQGMIQQVLERCRQRSKTHASITAPAGKCFLQRSAPREIHNTRVKHDLQEQVDKRQYDSGTRKRKKHGNPLPT